MRKTSAREKQLKGNSTKRRETTDTLKVETLEPEMPPWLDATAQAEWRRLVPLLIKAGTLSNLDGVPLGMLCMCYSTIQKCMKKLAMKGANGGPTFRSPQGHICQRPEVKILKDAQAQYLKLCEEFGMTPKARQNMKVPVTGKGGTGPGGGNNTPKNQRDKNFEDYFGQERSTMVGR